jgi:hypothetical protein
MKMCPDGFVVPVQRLRELLDGLPGGWHCRVCQFPNGLFLLSPDGEDLGWIDFAGEAVVGLKDWPEGPRTKPGVCSDCGEAAYVQLAIDPLSLARPELGLSAKPDFWCYPCFQRRVTDFGD